MIFAVLDLRVAEVVLKRRFKLQSFFYNNYILELYPYLDPDIGIFERLFNIAIGQFSQFGLYLWKIGKLIESSLKFYGRCIFGQGMAVPIIYWKLDLLQNWTGVVLGTGTLCYSQHVFVLALMKNQRLYYSLRDTVNITSKRFLLYH